MKKYVKCSDCDNLINISRIIGYESNCEDIICGQCIKKNYGNRSYNFWKDYINKDIEE